MAHNLAEQSAYRIMEIAIESNVGLCGMKISAKLNKQKLAAGCAKFIGYLLWHDVASAIHSGGKKAQFARNCAFSPELGERAIKEGKEVLGKFFDEVEISAFAFEKPSDEAKFLKFCQSLGLDPAKAKGAWEQANAKEEEKPSETIQ
jgi:hypothetical protein